MQKLPKLILVFCFLWFRAFAQIIAFFVTIVTDDLAGVAAIRALFLFFTVVGLSGINFSGQYGTFLGTTIFSALAIILFLLFPSLFRRSQPFIEELMLSVLKSYSYLGPWALWYLMFERANGLKGINYRFLLLAIEADILLWPWHQGLFWWPSSRSLGLDLVYLIRRK